jgi:hypothetical protein
MFTYLILDFFVALSSNSVSVGQVDSSLRAAESTSECIATEADEDPDVANRPCFVKLLNRKRISLGFHSPNASKISQDKFPSRYREELFGLANGVLLPQWMPQEMDKVHWYAIGYYGSTEFRPGNVVLGTWAVENIEFQISALSIRVRLPKRSALEFRPEPVRTLEELDKNLGWDFVSKAGLRDVLAEFFAIPFDQYDDFWVRGYLTGATDVPVFVGKFGLRKGSGNPDEEPADVDTKSWKGPHRILITDSDPQYLCVGFSFPKVE